MYRSTLDEGTRYTCPKLAGNKEANNILVYRVCKKYVIRSKAMRTLYVYHIGGIHHDWA